MAPFFTFPKRKLRKLIQQGEYEDAIQYGSSIESNFSNDADYWFIMGSIFYILEDAQRTLDYFDRSLSINPNDVETLHLKANVHLHLQQYDTALLCCKQILEKDSNNVDAKKIIDKINNSKFQHDDDDNNTN